MANASRDENRKPVGLAWDATNSTPASLLVDPVTGRLLIAIVSTVGSSPTAQSQPGARDANRTPVSLATNDNAGAAVVPLHIDSASGFLAIDLSIT